jgi:hypothetical protein
MRGVELRFNLGLCGENDNNLGNPIFFFFFFDLG